MARVWRNLGEAAHLVISSPSPPLSLSLLPRLSLVLLCYLSLSLSLQTPFLSLYAITIVVASQVDTRWRAKLKGCQLVRRQLRGGQFTVKVACAMRVAKPWLLGNIPPSSANPTVISGSQQVLVGLIITIVPFFVMNVFGSLVCIFVQKWQTFLVDSSQMESSL